MDYKPLAKTIIDNIGGKDNVKSVVHCATRLRFTLKDSSKANTDVLSKTKGVLKIVDAGGQYQIVIGPDVPQVYQEVISMGGFESKGAVEDDKSAKEDTRFTLSKVLEGIASIFQPVIPAITGAGLLKAFLALAATFHWLESGTQTHTILTALSDSAFYFLPALLAFSAAKKFKCNQGTAIALAGFLIYPSMVTLMGAEEAITLFGILPITKAHYTSSVIPIILGVWFMSVVEHTVQKYCPKAIKFFFVPFLSLFVGGVVTIFALGPIGAWLSNVIQAFFTWMKSVAPWLVPTVVGIFNPLLVMTGTHYGLIPIGTNNLATVGHDMVVGPGMLMSNVAQGAAGLAVAVRSKNPDTKQLASSSGLTGVLGITEPVLYGVNMKLTFPLYASMIGGGIGGLFLGLMGVERFGAGSPGLLVLPVYIPTEDAVALGFTMANFVNAIIGVCIAMAVSFVACWILFGIWAKTGKLDPSETGEATPVEDIGESKQDELYAPMVGEVVALNSIADETFASGVMGDGIAMIPSKGEVYAPCDCTVADIFPTAHALGLAADDGAEILIHVGMDTVKLEGKGFTPMVKAGSHVTRGQLLLKFDMDYIKSQGLPVVTPMVITNSGDYAAVKPVASGVVTKQNCVIQITK